MTKNLLFIYLCLLTSIGFAKTDTINFFKGDTLKINFQPVPGETSSTFNKFPSPSQNPVPNAPEGYLFDQGQLFGDQGNGLEYGCRVENKKSRWRKISFNRPDSLLFQSFNHMQNGGTHNTWEVAVPNGSYNVMLVAGDPNYGDFINTINIEGTTIVDKTPVKEFASGGKAFFDTIFATVKVADGRLTIAPDTASVWGAAKADNVKLAFVHISRLAVNIPAGDTLRVNFQPIPGETNGTFNKWGSTVPVPEPPKGFLYDYGQKYSKQASGLIYGCINENLKSRWRKILMDRPDSMLFQAFNHMQNGGTHNTWEVEVPNGTYNVLLVAGDPNYGDFINTVKIEGTTIIDQTPIKEFASGGKAFFDTIRAMVAVTDGKLTIAPDTASTLGAAKADNVKFSFVEIWKAPIDFTTGDTLNINFQPAPGETNSTFNKWGSSVPVPNPPAGYLVDQGQIYGLQTNGLTYGCQAENKKTRWRKIMMNQPDSLLFQTFNHMQNGGAYNSWEVEVPNDNYEVLLVAGDPNYGDFINTINVEGTTTVDQTPIKEFISGGKAFFDTIRATVAVTDGKLTIKPDTSSVWGNSKADNVKFSFVKIWKSTSIVAISALQLNQDTISIEEGQTTTLEVAILPIDASTKTVLWNSENNAIATVDATGKVTGVSAGETIIVVSTPDGTIKAKCTISVTSAIVAVTEITLSTNSLVLLVGASEKISATVVPENATDKNIKWSTSAPNIATVDEMGNVIAIAEGSCIITAATLDGKITATCNVKVNKTTGINNYNKQTLKLYPNPLKTGELTISHNNSGRVDISIVDITGVVRMVQKDCNQTVTIDCKSLSKGIYFVKVNQQVSKLIIE